MRAAFDQAPRERRFGRRAVALFIVAIVHVLLVLALYLAGPRIPPLAELPPIIVTLLPSIAPKPDRAPEPTPAKVERKQVVRVARAKERPKPPRAFDLPIIKLSRSEMESADISKIPTLTAERTADPGEGESTAGNSEFAEGAGPGGERLYKAEWFREPTHAEIAGYQPRPVPSGAWAVIACKMVDKFRVEDCQELAESPRGSGIARGVRRAAWQFRVRPPRLGGKDQLGVWVSIRIDFTEGGAG